MFVGRMQPVTSFSQPGGQGSDGISEVVVGGYDVVGGSDVVGGYDGVGGYVVDSWIHETPAALARAYPPKN